MVQFTSGSTAEPRGVVLTHRSILSNCFAIGKALNFHEPDHVGCAWLPLFHDMGLIGHVFVPLLWKIPNVLLPPESFALRPESWLEAVSGYGATISTAPNFAYQMASQRMKEEDLSKLDLSKWRVAMCGGEPILPETLTSFSDRFGSVGFRPESFCPVYGLAEFSLAMSLTPPSVEPVIERVDRDAFAREGRAVPSAGSANEQSFVASGLVAPEHELQIIDDDGSPLSEGQEGRVQGRGPSMMKEYLDNGEATKAAIKDGWLETGDRGFLRDGWLFVTGRSKEMIIKGGRNLYPQEVEALAGEVEGVRAGRVIAFGLVGESTGTDRLVLLCETRVQDEKEKSLLERKILGKVGGSLGMSPDQVVLLPPGTLTKTSSGKLQRVSAQKRFLAGELSPEGSDMSRLAKLWIARSANRILGRKA